MFKSKIDPWSQQYTPLTFQTLAGPVMAVCLSIISVGIAAQTSFEFEDPLEDVRARIENTAAPETGQVAPAVDAAPQPAAQSQEPASENGWAATATERAETRIAATTNDIRETSSSWSERLGLGSGTLLALLAAALLALAALIGKRLMGHREPVVPKQRIDTALYANRETANKERRTLDSGADAMRAKPRTAIDTNEEPESFDDYDFDGADEFNATDDPQEDAALFNDAMNEERPTIFRKSTAEPQKTRDEEALADDPSTWKRPNLDRLKASIREDWVGDSDGASMKKTVYDDPEAKAFAELFGDDEPSPVKAGNTDDSVLGLLETFEIAPEPQAMTASTPHDSPTDPEKVAELRKPAQAVPHAADEAEIRRKAGSTLPSHAEALRRVRALRDSVKAG